MFDFGKCLSTSLRNILPMFALTFFVVWWIKSNNIASPVLFLVIRGVNTTVGENPLFFSTASYSPFALLKMVSLEELSDNLRAMDSDICLMMGGCG